MFYGAFDEATAITETTAASWPPKQDLTIGVFVTQRELSIVELDELPPIPSLFDVPRRDARPSLIFLHRFARELSQPFDREEREHLEYVPTQIITEYFRHAYEAEYGTRVDGLVYRSSVHEGGRCIVLFIENDEFATAGGDDARDRKIALVLTRAYSILRRELVDGTA
jgi:RES domain